MTTDAQIENWLALSLSGISLKDLKILYEKFAEPQKIIGFLEKEPCLGKLARMIKSPDLKEKVRKIIEAAEKKKNRIVTLNDAEYPEKIKNIYDPPPVLFVRGQLFNPENKIVLAVVGTRSATAYGQAVLEKIIPALAQAGLIIASGLALGIDTLAHQLALANQGLTWAFLGNGIDVTYPNRNRALYQKITENGALVSEYPPGTEPSTWNFPRRNRLIAGAADGVLVVEADYQSGALITAKCAVDQGREVMAAPGSLFSKNSEGVHWLIKQGAALIEKPEDILEIFGLQKLFPKKLPFGAGTCPPKIFSPLQKKITGFLAAGPLSLEELIGKTRLPLAQLSVEIMTLVLGGVIQEQPGQRYLLI